MDRNWAVLLFNRSPLKQRKFIEITKLLGETQRLDCLDIGSDNGVISYLLRQQGGNWKSADLDDTVVAAISSLVGSEVFQINGWRTPFRDNKFDRVVIVDYLEHIHTDREFIVELFRIMKPGGELIVNIPHRKNSFLRKFRLAIGQTDQMHGHVRAGYTLSDLRSLLENRFTIVSHKTYSKFFSECVDTLISVLLGVIKKDRGISPKGLVVTQEDLNRLRRLFRIYSLMYPLVRWVVGFDRILFWCTGYMLIARARIDKR